MNKDLEKMSFRTALLFSLVLVVSAFAQQDSSSVEQRQLSLLDKLTNAEANALGLAINGYIKTGYLRSSLSSDALKPETGTAESQAYSQMGLVFSARPSSETVASVDLRLHKDWQNAHREGNNSPIINWWSYDGKILDQHLNFNLGHMRVGYTPFTVYQPMADFIFEPEIFVEHRKDVMAYKNMDGSENRLMQGLNAIYTSGQVGVFDDVVFHGTMARMRNVAKKNDQVFFDFDRSDRYMFAGHAGAEISGLTFGVNDVYSFDRIRSTRSRPVSRYDTLYYEDNNVLSFELGFDSEKMMQKNWHVGANVEYALSNWTLENDRVDSVHTRTLAIIKDTTIAPDGTPDYDQGYLTYVDSYSEEPKITELASLENKSAVRLNLFGEGTWNDLELKFSGNVLYVDKNFQAELAMTPATLSNIPVLNSDAAFTSSSLDTLLSSLRSGSLENLYFTLYQSVPLMSSNMLLKDPTQTESEYYRLYNNYKYAHYYRNGYNNVTLKRSELLEESMALDPTADIALPFGFATPNRKGGDIDFIAKWNDAISARFVFGLYSAENLALTDTSVFISGTDYIRFGGGINVDIGRLMHNSVLGLEVGGSYELTTETGYLERDASRAMFGFKASALDRYALLGGFQMFTRTFGNPYLGILNEVSEMLILVGPQIKIASGAYFSFQYGYLTNSIDYVDLLGQSATLDIDKNIIMADVTVRF